MINQEIINNDEIVEIDLRRVFDSLLNKAWLIVAASVVTAMLTLLITLFFITPEYEAKAMFYVNNNSLSVGNTSFSISSGDLTTSRNLVESYLVILNTWETLDAVIDYSGVDVSIRTLEEMITAKAVNETEIFEVVITNTSPQDAEKLANAIAYILPKRIDTIIEGTSAKIVSAAVLPSRPSSPSFVKNTLIGFMLGFLAVAGMITLQTIYDTVIHREEDVAQISKLPILADGVLLAVRQNYCNRHALQDTIHQFEFVNGRILGLLMTCATDAGAGYGKTYYKRYYRRYGRNYRYARAYEESLQEQKK